MADAARPGPPTASDAPIRPTGRSALSARSRAAVAAGKAVAGASKLARLGEGSVVGGNVALRVDPDLLRRLLTGRRVAIVSGTNGKTTTTALLVAAMGTAGRVVTNAKGANMPPGIVAALGGADPDAAAVLEVDERWVPAVLEHAPGATVLLLNLSRDQLDRSHEVRRIADGWRQAFGNDRAVRLVANADDPLVVWAAGLVPADRVTWVGTGTWWTLDAAGCPACGGRIEFAPDGWRCRSCDFTRPDVAASLIDADARTGAGSDAGTGYAVRIGDRDERLALAIPGRANGANGAMAVAAASTLGVRAAAAAAALAEVRSVAGRYRTAVIAGTPVHLLLAKNPSGWQEAIDMLSPAPVPVVAAINARIADGRDPSWLWDVPYERLAGRFVVATGERRHDLAVRLRYAEVDHVVADDLAGAVAAAVGRSGADRVDLIANYTAFQDYLDEVGRDDEEDDRDDERDADGTTDG